VAGRARSEVEAVGGPASAEDIDRLHFLEAVLYESLRLYPPIHLGNRRVEGSGSKPAADGLTPGTRLLYSIYLTHRDPRQWPDPDRFDPSRFEGPPAPPPYAYLPFGGGPRNCIGASFGLFESKVVLANLLGRWNLALIDRPVHAHMGATLEPRPGVWMEVARRGPS
jgi:cytochrome P450